jgi:hypothetical protein
LGIIGEHFNPQRRCILGIDLVEGEQVM